MRVGQDENNKGDNNHKNDTGFIDSTGGNTIRRLRQLHGVKQRVLV